MYTSRVVSRDPCLKDLRSFSANSRGNICTNNSSGSSGYVPSFPSSSPVFFFSSGNIHVDVGTPRDRGPSLKSPRVLVCLYRSGNTPTYVVSDLLHTRPFPHGTPSIEDARTRYRIPIKDCRDGSRHVIHNTTSS